MKPKASLLSTLLVGFLAANAGAWNDTGHMTIAELAWRSLSEGERQAASALLREKKKNQ